MKKQIKLIEEYSQNKLETLPRAIMGKAPEDKLMKICNEIDLLKSIVEFLKTAKKCENCKGTGNDGFDRSYPPNPYICEKCSGKGFI